MIKSWTGPLVTGVIAVGVGVVLVANLQKPGTHVAARPTLPPAPEVVVDPSPGPVGVGVQERPIGDPVVQNHVQVAAVYLPAVAMDGGDAGGTELIHLEADIKATEGNPNGFAKDEFVPYLKVAYEIVPAGGGPAIEKGDLYPMVASDGLHYGANVIKPGPGDYRLVFGVQPPSAGGLGRHSDKATGVAPWWKPFQASFDWTVEAKAAQTTVVGAR